jgi:hypothetical protein
METNLTSTERVLKLAPEGFSALAGLIDNSIQEAMGWLVKEREGFIDAYEVHTRIRGRILQTETHVNRRAAMAADKPTRLEELGVRLEGGPSLSIIAKVAGVAGDIRIMQRPRNVVNVQMVGPEGLFEPEYGPMYLFYTERGGCLHTLTLVETYTNKIDFFLKGCEAVDQHAVPRAAMVAPTSNATATDELSEFFRQVPDKYTQASGDATGTTDHDSLPREGTTDN